MAQVRAAESPIRARRRRRRVLFSYLSLALVWAVVGVLIWLAHASFLRINTVEVSGAQTVAQEAIETRVREVIGGSYFNLFPKDNIFLYPRAELTAALLRAYPTLHEITIKAKDFKSISVEARDREPRALWCGVRVEYPEPCRLMDEEGVVYADSPEFSADPFVSYYGALAGGSLPHYLSAQQFRSLSALVDALLQQRGTMGMQSVLVDVQGDVHARFNDGFVLRFTTEDDGGDVFERFTLALESDALKARPLSDFEYLDLRFGDRLYYKLKEE